MKRFIVAVAMILVVVCPLLADETKEATKEDEKAILAVMKDFEEGIAEKDAKRLAKIFIYPGTPFSAQIAASIPVSSTTNATLLPALSK